MLTKELLNYRKYKGTIKLNFCEDHALSQKVIDVFRAHEGKTCGELKKALRKLEGRDFKLVRGLSKVMERTCEFRQDSDIDPLKVREEAFRQGIVLTQDERKEAIKRIAEKFKATEEDIERALWADREENLVLCSVPELNSDTLLEKYNLALLQTLFFNAIDLEFSVSDNFQAIFRYINYFGLMYFVNNTTRITGPASLFKTTKKYGSSLAKLIPVIISANEWELSAKIQERYYGEPRIFTFTLKSSQKIPLESKALSGSLREKFDSSVENNFYNSFKALNTGWIIKREPSILKTEKGIFIPDFSFEKHGETHYLEIVGFWTPEYLKKKVEKIRSLDRGMLLAVNKGLNCYRGIFRPESSSATRIIIYYEKDVPVKPVYDFLKARESKMKRNQLEKVQQLDLKPSGPIIDLSEIASKYDVDVNAVVKAIDFEGYTRLGNTLVKDRLIPEIVEKIGNSLDSGASDIKDIEKILSNYKLEINSLDSLGFKLKWRGLSKAEVERV